MQSYDDRPSALLVWDMENVRLPDNPDSPQKDDVVWSKTPCPSINMGHLISQIKQGYMDPLFYKEWRATACITRVSLKAIEKKHPDFVDQMVPYIDITLASSYKKTNADYVLAREISTFLDSRPIPGSRLILLTGDGDFLGSVQRAIKMGIEVHVISYAASTSKVLVGAATYHYDWRDLLEKELIGGQVTLPYFDGNKEIA